MSQLLDAFPLLLFAAVFVLYGVFVSWDGAIFPATAAAIVASFIQIAYLLIRRQKVTQMHWLTLAILVILGGLTLILRDEAFIKWKPTAVYVAFAFVLIVAKLVWRRDLLRSALAAALKDVEIPDRVWSGLTWAWAVFFIFMAVLNWLIAFRLGLSTETWVAFKTAGALVLTLIFTLGTGIVLARYIQHTPEPPATETDESRA